jgi:2-polyprenyl-3-methyl-5-hydroxy-6-metoxy-1,4-benzoquinol methylase
MESETVREKILVIQSADIDLVARAITAIKSKGLFQQPKITLFCRNDTRSLKYAQQTANVDEYVPHVQAQNAVQHLRELRRRRYDVCVLFLTGDPSYAKIKYFAFLTGAKRILIFNENLDCFYFTWKSFAKFLAARMRALSQKSGQLKNQSEEPAVWNEKLFHSMRREPVIINKDAYRLRGDLQMLRVACIAEEILRLKQELTARGLKFTTWMGDFTSVNPDAEMAKLWENAWVMAHSDVRVGARVLDAGGASTIFSFYLASKGCEVSVIDKDWYGQGIIENAITVSQAMGWNMKITSGDITQPLPYPEEYFDSVFCVCVLEHLSSEERQRTMHSLARCLKKGGILGITVDYDIERGGDKGLRFRHLDVLYSDVIKPSGLALYGNDNLVDEYDERFFLGALFLKKPI